MNEGSLRKHTRRVRVRSVLRRLFRYGVLLLLAALVLIPMQRYALYEITHYKPIDCGSLLTWGSYSPERSAVGQQEIRCFVQAHQRCKAATLFQTSQGVDSAGVVTYRTANIFGGCVLSVIGYSEGCRLPFCGVAPFIDNNCRTMQQQQDGLHFLGCGSDVDWDFII